MPACSAPNCTNRPERPNGKTFHLFPKEGSLRQQWVREVNREYWTPSKRSLLCSDHFTESCFDKTGQTTRLKDNAVPTLFDIPAPTRKKARPREEPPETETVVPAQRGRPRKKQKQEMSSKLSREELEAKLQLLEEHNKKLTKLLSRSPRPSTVTETKKTESKNKNIFVFRYPRRQILLKVAYLGWDYQSCASQEEIQQSIEDKLLQALLKTNLTESIISSKFERCSSNSEGFSPFDQVISIIVRSNLKSGLGVIPPDKKAGSAVEENPTLPLCAEKNGEQEIDYARVVNEALPMEIRLLAWCPVQAGYSPKLTSPIKTFKYFFPRGSLNIENLR
ncbi:tRNA pseudouridine(38/39) synthase-like [Penaeus indicus]|uniref:tRNA pseudouridine(38/39) synthase-like n=1 Tax=Penaeus indicus TaxID=29960 RepID=UPI00300CD5EF